LRMCRRYRQECAKAQRNGANRSVLKQSCGASDRQGVAAFGQRQSLVGTEPNATPNHTLSQERTATPEASFKSALAR
jgi:hypothetical protein